jgi:hypothetical protein
MLMNEERTYLQTIDYRLSTSATQPKNTLAKCTYLITGRSPEWSNLFRYKQALDDVDDAQRTLRMALKDATEAQWSDDMATARRRTHVLACDAHTPYGPHWGFDQRPPTIVHWWANAGEEGFYTSVNETEPQQPFPAPHWKPLGSPPTTDGSCVS